MQLKILSWNIWVDCHFDKVKDLLSTCDADIIGLQEVQDHDKGRDVIGYLAELGYQHVFAPIEIIGLGGKIYNFGPAIFSKYKILSSEIYKLSEAEARVALRADIEVEGKILHIFNAHILHTHQQPSEIQELQVENLVKVLPKEKTIVMGDFNATPESVAIQKMRDVMIDADLAAIPTLNAEFFDCKKCNLAAIPYICSDYIFTSKDIRPHSFKVYPPAGSDHLAISVVVEM